MVTSVLSVAGNASISVSTAPILVDNVAVSLVILSDNVVVWPVIEDCSVVVWPVISDRIVDVFVVCAAKPAEISDCMAPNSPFEKEATAL